ncbi:MAG: NAD-dependent epimerase [Flavobacteriales bacterium]|jgi:UDP-glucuronate 4-epimerase
MKRILVTGAAGFIGYHTVQRLVDEGHYVVGLDNLNTYYDIRLKFGRLDNMGISSSKLLQGALLPSSKFKNYHFIQLNLVDRAPLNQLFTDQKFDYVVNLAAQAGVRYSIEKPSVYIESNIVGFANILEACRNFEIKHLTYASSSSVYGLNESVPFSTQDSTNHPMSLYAATKKSNELLAHTYSHLFQLPTSGIRFFTVYGPWGRPDMAYYIFANKITSGEKIDVYNNGIMERDFTYVDDIVEGTIKVLKQPPVPSVNWNPLNPQADTSSAPYRIYNIGANEPVKLMDFINTLEDSLGMKAELNYMPIQPGDVTKTWANVDNLINDFDYSPKTSLKDGISQFVNWYKEFHKV